MPRDIMSNWDSGKEPPVNFSRISGIVRPQMPVKEKIAQSVFKLKIQQSKLENSAHKMQRHDKNLFDKCISAQMAKDSARAALYASECVEIRKMASTVLRCQLALEKAIIRLENIEIWGEAASMLRPVAGVVNSIKSQISGIMPEVSFALGEIVESLNSTSLEVGDVTGQQYDEGASDTATQHILSEANAVAAQRMNEKFPDLPKVAERAGFTYTESCTT
jgi:division protein CdvB (Snf7/Vps24/ESCRT-III family)